MANENVLLAQAHSGLIPQSIADELIQKAAQQSVILKLCQTVTMDEPEVIFPTLADVVGMGAYVGEGQTIPIVTPKSIDVKLKAHRISFIIPCTKDFGDLTVLDLLTTYQQVIQDMFVKILDQSILVGATEIGTTGNVFQTILENAKKQTTEKGTNGTEDINLLDDISDCISVVTGNNFPVTGILANLGLENKLRKLKDTTNNFLFENTNSLFGKEMTYTNYFDDSTATCIVGDWSRCIVGIFKDLKYDYFDSGVVDLGDGNKLNLISQYAAALRITAYVASNIVYPDAFACVATKAKADEGQK